MMTLKEAYEKSKKLSNKKYLIECLDLGDKWAFLFHDELVDENDDLLDVFYDVVNKNTGETGIIPANMDGLSILLKGKQIDIKQLQR